MYPHITHIKYLPLSEHNYAKTKTATKGSYEEKQRGYLNQWSHCCSLMVLKIGGQKQSVSL